MPVQKICPFLWFNDNAEAAADFYISIFKDSRVLKKMASPDGKVVSGGDLVFRQLRDAIDIAALQKACKG